MLREATTNLHRLRQITRIIGKYGYDEFLRRPAGSKEDEAPGAPEVGSNGAEPPRGTAARRFRLMLEELGPTFIKFGQVLSSRPDLVSREFVDELKELQYQCLPIGFDAIHLALREGLKADPATLFKRIDEKPLATASIAQVHRGATAAGDEVVIKIQRPGIAQEVRSDIDLLYQLARLLHAVVEESQMAEPVGIVREFDRALLEELNFQVEAANLREFKKLHEGRTDIEIPSVYPDLSSTTVLTLSFLDGVPFTNLPADADKKAIAERIVREAFDEVFLDGVFHADPHAGNLMLLADGRYGILDFGLVGRLTPQMRETLVVLALAIAMRDADTAARTVYRLGQSDERVSIAEVRDDTNMLFERYLGKQIRDVDSKMLLQEFLLLAMKHKIRVPPEYTLLAKAGGTIEGMVREFHPEIDIAKVATPYAERLLIGRVSPTNLQGGLYRALLQFQGLSQDVPLQLSQILSDLSSGNFSVNITGRQFERLTATLLISATTLSAAILGGAFVIGAFVALAKLDWTFLGIPIVAIFGAVSALTVFSWLGLYVVLRPRVRKISLLKLLSRRKG